MLKEVRGRHQIGDSTHRVQPCAPSPPPLRPPSISVQRARLRAEGKGADGIETAEQVHLHRTRRGVVERAPGQRGFVVIENRWLAERTFGALDDWGGLLRSRAGRLDVVVARLACAITLSGVDALANPSQILKITA